MKAKVHPMKKLLERSLSSGLVAWLMAGSLSIPAVALEADVRRDLTVETIEKVLPSVVNIATASVVNYPDGYEEAFTRFYGKRPPTEKLNSIGSGVIIDEDGYLLTNLHVLRRASHVQVKLWNGELYDAEPRVATSQKDVALLQIIAPRGKKFQAMKFAKDDDLLLGETVIALGNPYGLGGSVTRGILSSKNRRISSGQEQLGFQDWLQTDADINPGNSGGPLINLRGELIGINAAVYREDQGMGVGFAIPIKQVSAALPDFFTLEAFDGNWFGARIGPFNPPLTITSVQPRSPADKAGLRVGQVITTVNGQSPRSLAEFHRLATANADLTATIQVEADGQRRSTITQMITFKDLIQQRLGAVLRDLTPADVGIKPGDGVIIEQIEKNSPADKAKLRPGFLLTAADDRKTGTLLNAADVVSAKQTGERLKLSFIVPRSFGARAGDYNTTLTVR
jgi:S1-C subfamily serine protease